MPPDFHFRLSPERWRSTFLVLSLRALCYADDGTANSQFGNASWPTGAGNSTLGHTTAISSFTEVTTPGMIPSLRVKASPEYLPAFCT